MKHDNAGLGFLVEVNSLLGLEEIALFFLVEGRYKASKSRTSIIGKQEVTQQCSVAKM